MKPFEPLTPVNGELLSSVHSAGQKLVIQSHLNMNFFLLSFAPELGSSFQADFFFLFLFWGGGLFSRTHS